MSEGTKFDLNVWLKGNGKAQHYEHISFLLICVATLLIMVGTIVGSFVRYTVYIAAAGALLLLPGIILYIASQLMEVRHETAAAKPAASAPRAEHARQ